jgi:hypothetical protein
MAIQKILMMHFTYAKRFLALASLIFTRAKCILATARLILNRAKHAWLQPE